MSTLRILVLPMGSVNLGLSIDQIYRVMVYPEVFGQPGESLGLAQIEGQAVSVLDLHGEIAPRSPAILPNYLVLGLGKSGERYGIPVAEAPSLVEVPLERVRRLPESYRRKVRLGIATHIVMVEENEQPLTIFLVDLDQLALTGASLG